MRCATEEKQAGSCTWELAPFAEPVPINDFTVQTATAHGTCRFDKGSKHCGAPLGPGVTLSIQADVYRVKVITQAPLEGTAHGSCEADGKFGSGYSAAHLQSGVRAIGSDAAEQLYVSWADTFVGEITAIKSSGKKKGGHHPEPDAGAKSMGVVQYVASLTAPVPIKGHAKEHAELPFMRLGEYYFEFPAEEAGPQYKA